MTRVVCRLSALALLAVAWAATTPAAAATLSRWVQFGVDGGVLVRAIVDGADAACPSAAIDGVTLPLVRRGNADDTAGAFPVTMCEAIVPPGALSATLDGQRLKLPVADPRRIVVIGDTGCRVLPTALQACNDPGPGGFPLARLAQMVGSLDPDLIVHVGDYYYRESPCPPGNEGCAGTPFGDTWDAWNADWFTPARAILEAAPLALTRGNHESCGRGAKGWYALLDPRPYEAAAVTCAFGSRYDYPASYIVDAGAVSLIMFDSSYANTGRVDSLVESSFAKVEALTASVYAPDLARQVAALGGKPAFLVTHRPAYGLVKPRRGADPRRFVGGSPDAQALFAGGVPAPIKALFAGHIHQFEAVQMAGELAAPQLIVGMSGTYLDEPATPEVRTTGGLYPVPDGSALAVEAITNIAGEFGFAVLDRVEDGYAVNLYFLDGVAHGNCVLRTAGARRVTCAP